MLTDFVVMGSDVCLVYVAQFVFQVLECPVEV